MKKKILFAARKMDVGGVEKSLIAIINTFPIDCYDIHLALMLPGGKLEADIPDGVTIHIIEPYCDNNNFMMSPLKTTITDLFHGLAFKSLTRIAVYTYSKICDTLDPLYKYLLKDDSPLSEIVFDLAINYAGPSEALDWFITRHIKAKRKAMWIHFDLNLAFNRRKSALRHYGEYDRVFCVSQHALDVYCKRYPQFANKATTFFNIVDSKLILEEAEKPSTFKPSVNGVIDIVTVARATKPKGIDLAIRAIPMILRSIPDIRWHFVGDGIDLDSFKKLAIDLGVESKITFYGIQTNPYPFMKQADIYVQPSRHEGYCITIAEAKNFEAPIVATDFGGAREQLEGIRPNSVVVEISSEGIARGVIEASKMARQASEMLPSEDLPKLLELLD